MTDGVVKYQDIKKIPGWLSWVDYELFRNLIVFQNNFCGSAIVEIGVHHGKSLILLASASVSRQIYVIDIFGNQEKNIDQSGSGDLNAFRLNLKNSGIDEGRIFIDQRMSTDVNSNDIESSIGRVGFFHIDGGHHYDAVAADIELALAICEDKAIIVLDDVFRPEWPEVSMATFGSSSLVDAGFVPFAVGFNKTYFCRKQFAIDYQNELKANELLRIHLSKFYQVGDRAIFIYQRYPLPEWRLHTLLSWYFSIRQPLLFNKYFSTAKHVFKMVKSLTRG